MKMMAVAASIGKDGEKKTKALFIKLVSLRRLKRKLRCVSNPEIIQCGLNNCQFSIEEKFSSVFFNVDKKLNKAFIVI